MRKKCLMVSYLSLFGHTIYIHVECPVRKKCLMVSYLSPYGHIIGCRSLWPSLRSQEVMLSSIGIHVFHVFHFIKYFHIQRIFL